MAAEIPKTTLSIRDLPDSERPRERLLLKGAQALSNAELLAVILRTGSAKENVLHLAERVLATCDGLQGLVQASPAQLEQISGLGTTKITQLLASVELGRRLMAQPSHEQPVINSSEDAVRLVSDMRHLTQEHVRLILLDNGQHVISIPTIYIGTLNASVLRVSEIFREAIHRNSPAVILVHNHPSGDAAPSPEDIELTHTLIAAGQLLDIQLMDHLIISPRDWVSLKQMGLAFT
jgi:DNA repair protein RadC